MNRMVLGTAIAAIIIGVAVYFSTRPEPVPPTPKERLTQATEEIRTATQEATGAVSDAARQTGEDLASQVSEGADEVKAAVAEIAAGMAGRVSQFSQETQGQLTRFLTDWRATGIVTQDGIDLGKAAAAVEASDLSVEAKANIMAVLTALQDAPGAFEEKLEALKSLL